MASAGSAPNVVGQKFSDARTALSSAGFKPLVSTTVGDQLQWPNCVVTNQVARTVSAPANSGGSSSSQVLLSLNCEAAYATAGSPGNSLGSPAGSQAYASAAASAAAAASSASAAAEAEAAAAADSGQVWEGQNAPR
ncbi:MULTISPECIES: PASTA domain-containing protein [Mycobacteriaceae]|uniref:PASTA domain-containing protein n=1 Tax=Mycolicibacterium mucogenicum DSM 44124 TaxID=1226753 RepID=A0A8E4W333_MYCMU|nr:MULTISPECIES: PASTA domain-containing protein [Mycobacteriaceae]QPG69787.1 PASTA domain-containing protein [Mycolicibacterium mucogenicum DSM 44124]